MGKDHKEYTWNLVAKKLAGEATPEELRELDELLRNNPDLYYPLQTISDLWKHTPPVNPRDIEQAEKAFSAHLDRMGDLRLEPGPAAVSDDLLPAKRRSPLRRIAILTVPLACVLIGLGWYLRHADRTTPPQVAVKPAPVTNAANEIYTTNGSRTHLTLPDGTRVWLNAGSRIDYPKNFGNTQREVELTGEAFFDVAANAARPFVIHTRRIDILVLGTSFNVKSYPADRTTEATLIRGSIEVSIRNRPSDKIVLKPNEKLVVSNDDSLLRVPVVRRHALRTNPSLVVISKPTYEEHTGAMIETSWVYNKLIFQDETFAELARQMERWYGISIRFDNPRLEELQFTGIFEKETIRQALDALRLTADFNYTIEGTQITIHN
ncbi:MAG TPA: FecR domain-containing protein [Puia sp.]|nr:FecR domain-containing protein [Puia sp.]